MRFKIFDSIFQYFLCLLLCLFLGSNLSAQRYSNEFNDINPIQIGNSILVSDDYFINYQYSLVEEMNTTRARVILQVDEKDNQTPHSYTMDQPYKVDVQVEYWFEDDSPSTFPNNTPNLVQIVELSLMYEADKEVASEYLDFYDLPFANIVALRLTILDIQGTDGSLPIKLSSEIYIDRLFNFNQEAAPQIASYSAVGSKLLHCFWNSIDGADSYDFEWTFYDDESEVGSTATPTIIPNSLFRNNATRINTWSTNYKTHIMYPAGKIFTRVRAVRLNNGVKETGIWSDPMEFIIDAYPFQIDVHKQTNVVFSEEGKYVPSVSYLDGTFRPRQSVTVRNESQVPFVATSIREQIVYDYYGRPKLQTMAIPGNGDGVHYDPDFLQYGSLLDIGDPEFPSTTMYTKEQFDDSDICDATYSEVRPDEGAGKYYSIYNTFKNGSNSHEWVPNAHGYPYTINEYLPDLTGRPLKSNLPGSTFRMGSGNETEYFYSDPKQDELERLFTSDDLGELDHYQKNMIRNANEQLSVSYMDAHGRVIATALAGDTPLNLRDLEPVDPNNNPKNYGSGVSEPFLENLINQETNSLGIKSTSTQGLTNQMDYVLDYNFTPQVINLLDEEICTTNLCAECMYSLQVDVFSQCGDLEYTETLSNYDPAMAITLGTSCLTEDLSLNTTLPLSIGDYHFSKTLVLDDGVRQDYLDLIINDAACIPDFEALMAIEISKTDFSPCFMQNMDCDELMTEDEFIDYYNSTLASFGIGVGETARTAEDVYAEILADCDLQTGVTECFNMLSIMRADMSPGGAYFDYVIIDGNVQYTLNPAHNHVNGFSILAPIDLQTTNYSTVFYDVTNDDFWFDIDGVLTYITELDPIQFVNNFHPSWVDYLITIHPQYTCYEECIDPGNDGCHNYDNILRSINTFQEALDHPLGLIESPTCIPQLLENDPCFDLEDLCDSGYEEIQTVLGDMFTGLSCTEREITSLITQIVHCNGQLPCTEFFGKGCDADNDRAWRMWRDLYLSIKSQIEPENQSCSILSFIKDRYGDELPSVVFHDGEWTAAEIEAEHANQEMLLEDQCDVICEELSMTWLNKISDCSLVTTNNKATLVDYFFEVCRSGCDARMPNGATSVDINGNYYATSSIQALGITDVASAMNAVLGTLDNCDEDCSTFKIDYPGRYPESDDEIFSDQLYLNTTVINTLSELVDENGNECLCDRLGTMHSSYVMNGNYTHFADYLNEFEGSNLSMLDIDKLFYYCDMDEDGIDYDCNSLEAAAYIPPILDCNTCKTYLEIEAILDNFNCFTSVASMTYFLNDHLGWIIAEDELATFLYAHNFTLGSALPATTSVPESNPQYYLCPSIFESGLPKAEDCIAQILETIEIKVREIIRTEIKRISEVFNSTYKRECNKLSNETYTLSGEFTEYHYTLYYYDIAGNLVKTIPPDGVDLTNPANHTKATEYRYNSLNQLIWKKAPDTAEPSQYWYDLKGRIIASQDGRQKELDLYSYTEYDPLGRVVEVGEAEISTSFESLFQEVNHFVANEEEFINTLTNKQFITRTTYDTPSFANSEPLCNPFIQKNLRNRITSMETDEDDDGIYEYATHYTYDIAGNVDEMLQEFAILPDCEDRYKRIKYEYDLISGNVKLIVFQKGLADQFSHAYLYDDNNRLVEVYSSFLENEYLPDMVNNDFWHKEASYEYFKHGPVARTVVGNIIQGMDYAYNINGWIKGMNSSIISTNKDMGKDGLFQGKPAKDALSFTLGYYDNDYTQVGSGNGQFELYGYNPIGTTGEELFNGNVRNMSVDIAGIDEAINYRYEYDQLDRLLTSNSSGPNTSGFSWGTSTTDKYRTDYTYDPDGNIMTLLRKDENSNNIDNLDYHYENPGVNNLLSSVEDLSLNVEGLPNGQTDPNQPGVEPNYLYDDSGNLIADDQEDTLIEWNPYGKVDKITKKTDGSYVKFGYDASQNRVLKRRFDAAGNQVGSDYYLRDADGNVLHTYTSTNDTDITWNEAHLYGSERIGFVKVDEPISATATEPIFVNLHKEDTGKKQYELTNHLGNVLVTLSDRKHELIANGFIDKFEPVVKTANDYYPFGLKISGRSFYLGGANSYRYGFNGKEKDQDGEWGSTTHYDYGFRIYNPAIAKFLSVDPLAPEYPFYTPYQFAGNMPIQAIDLDGLEPQHVGKENEVASAPDQASDIVSDWTWYDGVGWAANTLEDVNVVGLSTRHSNDILRPAPDKNFMHGLKNNGILGSIIYDSANGINVFVRQPFYGRGDYIPTLDGGAVVKGSEDGITAGIDGMASLIPLGKLATPAKAAAKVSKPALTVMRSGLNPNRKAFKSFMEMTEAELAAFNHAISRHGKEFGLKWGKKSTLPKLVDDFNDAVMNIRVHGNFMGVQKVKYGVKGSGQSSKLVDANVYNHVVDGKTFYYWETIGGDFISAGLKTN